jgi:hypothetical protein
MSYLLSTLRSATPERHQQAVRGLRDSTLSITMAFRTEEEVRALVKNGDGHEDGVNLSDRGNFCSCKDALYRGTTCKHQIALCVFILQQNKLAEDKIHLMWDNGTILCGATEVKRFWQNWTYNALKSELLTHQPRAAQAPLFPCGQCLF